MKTVIRISTIATILELLVVGSILILDGRAIESPMKIALGILLSLQFLILFSIVTYLGNEYLLTLEELREQRGEYRELNKQLREKIETIGKHEALKIVDNLKQKR